MFNREQFQTALEEVLGSRQVYFQPPENVRMSYPAIVYQISTIRGDHADDIFYRDRTGYTVTLIDKDPSSIYVKSLLKFRYSAFDRFFRADNLNHFVFTMYV